MLPQEKIAFMISKCLDQHAQCAFKSYAFYHHKRSSLISCLPPLIQYIVCTSHLYPLLPHEDSGPSDISPALWGQAEGNNPTLNPALHYRKSQRGRCPNVITPPLPWHCGDNQKVLALHQSLAIPPLSP